jgi:hypothetical protein
MSDINTRTPSKECTKCKTTHLIHMFKSKNKNDPSKRCSWCKLCMNEYAKIYRQKLNYPVSVTKKECHNCKLTKPSSCFSLCNKDKSGLMSKCKTCTRNDRLIFMKDVRNFLISRRADAKKRCDKNKKIDFNISTEDWIAQYEKQNGICALTGIRMTWNYSSDENKDFYSAVKYPFNISPDRIDSSQGYTKDNLQFVCNRVNAMKNNMSTEELISFCTKIVDRVRLKV